MRNNLSVLEQILPNIPISHFQTAHNTLCMPPNILNKHCFQFLLGHTVVPKEIKNNAYAKFFFFGGGGGQTKCVMGNVQWQIRNLCMESDKERIC